MNKFDPEIVSLRRDIENEVKRKIKTPYDFEFLVGVVWDAYTNIFHLPHSKDCGAI